MNTASGKAVQRYAAWHLLRVFFEDLEQWQTLCSKLQIPSTITREQYDTLFKGTNADIYIPLWASACIGGEDILLNEVTLEVIRYYKKYGYQWVDMDGNPPDFIGQQCRFLEYLWRTDDSGCPEAAERFIRKFFLDTAHKMQMELEKTALYDTVKGVLEILDAAITGDSARLPQVPAAVCQEFDSWTWTRRPEIPLEPEHVTSHASFCDCGNKCKMLARVQEGCVLSIFPDRNVPEKDFAGCSRGRAYRQTFLTSRRLRYPMKRVGERGSGQFCRISWEEAAKLVAEGIRSSGEKYGPESRFVTSASGVSALVRGDRFVKHLLSLEGGYLDYYNTYSIGCAQQTLPYIYGTNVCGSTERDLLNSKLIIFWGHNPANTLWGDSQLGVLVEAKIRGFP